MSPARWSFAVGRVLAIIAAMLLVSTPASSQFGGLKNKLKGQAAQKAAEKGVDAAAGDPPAPAGPGAANNPGGGTLVLTPEAVDRLIAAHRTAQEERDRAAREDNVYGRYQRDVAAYKAAQPKCGAAQLTWGQRAVADSVLSEQYSTLLQKAIDASAKGDNAGMTRYQLQAVSLIDPSCAVQQPDRPSDYYELQRQIDARAEQAALKSSGFTASEYGQANDRALAILSGTAPAGDASPAEKAAVQARSAELKSALGIREEEATRIAKPAPAPASAPAAPTGAPAVPAGPSALNMCMANNAQAHQAEIEALGDRGQAAQKAGNTAAMMAIADSIMRIQMAGCAGAR